MNTVGAYEAKTHLPKLLERVSKGESFTITKHGVPVAKIVPIDRVRQLTPETVIQELRAFRQGRKLKGISIREMIQEGRRF